MSRVVPWIRRVANSTRGTSKSRRDVARDMEDYGAYYSIALLFTRSDAERLGHLRAKYSTHHDIPYNHLSLLSRCPPDFSDLYTQTIFYVSAREENFKLRLTDPYVGRRNDGEKIVCVGITSPLLAKIHGYLLERLSSVVPQEQVIKRHALMFNTPVTQNRGEEIVKRIQQERQQQGFDEIEASGLALIRHTSKRVQRTGALPRQTKLFYFQRPLSLEFCVDKAINHPNKGRTLRRPVLF